MINLLFDIDGVLYEGDSVIEGAPETIQWCEEKQIPHLFLTNTTSKPRKAICEKLNNMGIIAREKDILTPPMATVQWLKENLSTKARVALFIPEKTKSEFQGFDLVEYEDTGDVDAVIVGDMGDAWNYQLMNQAFRMLMKDPRPHLIALGMTRYWQASDGLRLDTAPFVSALECASGVEAKVMGKPSELFFHAALKLLSASKENSFMIGDDIKGDIDGAQRSGLNGILVKTGKFRNEDLSLGIKPFKLIDSVKELSNLVESYL